MLRVPFWLARRGALEFDRQFLCDVAYSTLSGFLFIRLVDDVMDGDSAGEERRRILPAVAYFQSRFELPYCRHFAADHLFWTYFFRSWDEHADATTADAFCETFTLDSFRNIAGRKFSATKVPLAAAAFRYSTPNVIGPWHEFIDRLGAYCQLSNDLFDWHHDDKFENTTYIRSEWLLRRSEGESLACWIVREGFDWGQALLTEWGLEMERQVAALGCPEALQWMAARNAVLRSDLDELRGGLRPIRVLYDVWQRSAASPPIHH